MVTDPRTIETALGLMRCEKPLNEGLYGSVYRACQSRSEADACSVGRKAAGPCVAIKQAKTGAKAATAKEALVHESSVLYDLWTAAEALNDVECKAHTVRYYASLESLQGSWLMTELVDGTVLQQMLGRLTEQDAASVALQLLGTMHSWRKLVPEMVHGDLHGGNIFLMPRPASHKTCRFEYSKETDDGDFTYKSFTVGGRYQVRVIDFGLAESKMRRFLSHPGGLDTSNGITNWSIDALMALDAVYQQSDARGRKLVQSFTRRALGDAAADYFEDPEGQAYRVPLKTVGTLDSFLDTAVSAFGLYAFGEPGRSRRSTSARSQKKSRKVKSAAS